jgi:hypothetical protein
MATDDQIAVAIAWLESNEGDGVEAESCKATIELLSAILQRRSRDRVVYEVAKQSGRSRSDVRKLLKARSLEVKAING